VTDFSRKNYTVSNLVLRLLYTLMVPVQYVYITYKFASQMTDAQKVTKFWSYV